MYGWLAPRPDIPRDESHFGLYLRPDLDTRWEEFTLARDALGESDGRVLDAGCGFEPGVHMMPEIAAGLGWDVEAIDLLVGKQWSHLFHLWDTFCPHERIHRRVMDMCATDYASASFDAYLNLSVLEHVDPLTRTRALREADRVLKPGGLMVLTFDGLWPSLDLAGYDLGDPVVPARPLTNDLGQPVSFVTAIKL